MGGRRTSSRTAASPRSTATHATVVPGWDGHNAAELDTRVYEGIAATAAGTGSTQADRGSRGDSEGAGSRYAMLWLPSTDEREAEGEGGEQKSDDEQDDLAAQQDVLQAESAILRANMEAMA